MGKRNFFIDNKVVIKPRKEKGAPLVGTNALMVAIPSDLAFMVDLSHADRAALGSFSPFKLFIAGKDKVPFALAGPILGAPQGVIVMEKLIALGAKRIWVLGWCGSLQPYLLIGDLIIPTTSVSEEGTSHHYPVNRKRRQTSPFLNKRLEDVLLKANLPFKKGPVWTTDAIYRETEIKIIEYQKKGLLAVEMEMSALINVALFRSVELAGLLTVSDELFSLKWKQGFSKNIVKEKSIQAGRMLFELCMDRD